MVEKNKIVVFDEDTVILQLLKEYFRNYDYDIIAVSNTDHLLDEIHDPSICVTVIGIKEEGEYERALVEDIFRLNPDIKIIFISSYPTIEFVLEALRFNVFDIVIKPFRLESLEATVKRALSCPRQHTTIRLLQKRIAVLEEALKKHNIPVPDLSPEQAGELGIITDDPLVKSQTEAPPELVNSFRNVKLN